MIAYTNACNGSNHTGSPTRNVYWRNRLYPGFPGYFPEGQVMFGDEFKIYRLQLPTNYPFNRQDDFTIKWARGYFDV